MKRLLAVLMACTLIYGCVTAYASKDEERSVNVLREGWQNATDEELEAASRLIAKELRARQRAALKAASATPTPEPEATRIEEVVIHGSGTVIESVSVPFFPAKAVIDGQPGISVQIQGKRNVDAYGMTGHTEELLKENGNLTCLITAEGDWTIQFVPVISGGNTVPELHGNRGTISDAFTLDGPIIVHVTANVPDANYDDEDDYADDVSGYFSVYLYAHTIAGWNKAGDNVHEFCLGGEKLEKDLILDPKSSVYGDADMFVLYIQDDVGAEWSVTAK